MKKITVFIICCFSSTIAYLQTQLFKDKNFNNGEYYLLGLRSESDPNRLADSLGTFYIDDIKVLNEIKKTWKFKKKSPFYACGYHYNIIICKNGIEIDRFSINLNCNIIATDRGYFYFDEVLLRQFKDKTKKPYRKEEKFSTLADARDYRLKVVANRLLIFTPTLDWQKYEGTFKFTFVCPKTTKDCYDDEKRVLLKLKSEIQKTYIGEQFEIEGRGGSNTDLYVQLRCNKSLSDKFKLYKRDLQYDKWHPYNHTFTTYWVKEPD